MSAAVREQLCEAIAGFRRVRFRYRDNLLRVVEPHLVGLNTASHDVLVCWRQQRENPGAEDEPAWRSYLLDEIRMLELLDETFEGPRPGYNPDDAQIRQVYCYIPYVPLTGG